MCSVVVMSNSSIEQYIQSNELRWSASTIKSERARLSNLPTSWMTAPPAAVYKQLTARDLSAYTIKTMFIRMSAFYSFLHPNESNPFKEFMRSHANLFKFAYKKRSVNVTFEQAAARIEQIADERDRLKARQLLASGMRYTESCATFDGEHVFGKGRKPRRVHVPEALKLIQGRSYSSLYRSLKKIGLTPHALRKLTATKASKLGASPATLMAMFGWSSMQTASAYLQAENENDIARRIHEEI